MARIAIVGNAPFDADYSVAIDQADFVVRFNNAHGFGKDRGSKIDDLFLVNCGGQALEWLQTDDFWKRPQVVATPKVTLPIAVRRDHELSGIGATDSPDIVDGVNFEREMRAKLVSMSKAVSTLPTKSYDDSRQVLEDLNRDAFLGEPSSGFLAILHYFRNVQPDDIIEIFGFGFAGWQGHAWHLEREWVEQQSKLERLIWHRPPHAS